MKKAFIFVGIALGVGITLFATIFEEVGVKIVMSGFGAIAGIAVGGAVGSICEHGFGPRKAVMHNDEDALVGLGVMPVDLAHNYWRDKGRLPLTSDLEPERGRHMFDGDY